ncbi:MAG: dihydroorotase [Proteobacteria bacterium]|jgi:dihydroorotase|nr:dihydroorotase [Pseudomonadota bacterium]
MRNHFILNNARLIDPELDKEFDGALEIKDGFIYKVHKVTPDLNIKNIDCQGKYLAPGIIDIGVKICEPGERHKESFKTAGQAAAAGGVTTMVTRADTIPTVDTPEILSFMLKRASEATPVNISPMACLTKGRNGREMVEMSFLIDSGAVAFSDGDHVLTDIKVFIRALTYAKSLNALVIAHPQEPTLSKGATSTSGKFASLRGLPAVSAMAERIGLERDLAVVEMTGASYHADQITTASSLPALIRAKKLGLDVTAGISIHHLTLNELDVGDYKTFFKVKPPLRSEQDRELMVEAIKSGVIDIICSMHTPQDEESKRLPFETAASGAVGLETLLPAALRLYHSNGISLNLLWKALSLTPARRLGLPGGTLKNGAPADLIIFDPNLPFILDRETLKSKSKNTPFDSQRMQGRVWKTFVAGEEVYSS